MQLGNPKTPSSRYERAVASDSAVLGMEEGATRSYGHFPIGAACIRANVSPALLPLICPACIRSGHSSSSLPPLFAPHASERFVTATPDARRVQTNSTPVIGRPDWSSRKSCAKQGPLRVWTRLSEHMAVIMSSAIPHVMSRHSWFLDSHAPSPESFSRPNARKPKSTIVSTSS